MFFLIIMLVLDNLSEIHKINNKNFHFSDQKVLILFFIKYSTFMKHFCLSTSVNDQIHFYVNLYIENFNNLEIDTFVDDSEKT